jgi:transcriptional regulator NrdR family protein
MECPHCGENVNKVIDSRPFQEGVGIQRRRKCLACAGRFNTYESTEGQLVRILMRRDARPKSTIASVRAVGKSMVIALKTLTEETENLIVKVNVLEKSKGKTAKKPEHRVAAKVGAKRKAGVQKPSVRKARKLTDIDRVLNVINRHHKRGADLKKLRDRTGFEDDKVRGIVSRACKAGKIKRVSRGIYIAA